MMICPLYGGNRLVTFGKFLSFQLSVLGSRDLLLLFGENAFEF